MYAFVFIIITSSLIYYTNRCIFRNFLTKFVCKCSNIIICLFSLWVYFSTVGVFDLMYIKFQLCSSSRFEIKLQIGKHNSNSRKIDSKKYNSNIIICKLIFELVFKYSFLQLQSIGRFFHFKSYYSPKRYNYREFFNFRIIVFFYFRDKLFFRLCFEWNILIDKLIKNNIKI